MSDQDEDSFIGSGWSFPPTFLKSQEQVVTVSGNLDIQQSLYVLLGTIPGERVMVPNYGCGIHQVVFEVMDETLAAYIAQLVRQAILDFEPRIDVDDIKVTQADGFVGILYISIDYTIRTTNSRSNMVYPFYLEEGTNLRDKIPTSS